MLKREGPSDAGMPFEGTGTALRDIMFGRIW